MKKAKFWASLTTAWLLSLAVWAQTPTDDANAQRTFKENANRALRGLPPKDMPVEELLQIAEQARQQNEGKPLSFEQRVAAIKAAKGVDDQTAFGLAQQQLSEEAKRVSPQAEALLAKIEAGQILTQAELDALTPDLQRQIVELRKAHNEAAMQNELKRKNEQEAKAKAEGYARNPLNVDVRTVKLDKLSAAQREQLFAQENYLYKRWIQMEEQFGGNIPEAQKAAVQAKLLAEYQHVLQIQQKK